MIKKCFAVCPDCSPTHQLNHRRERMFDFFSFATERLFEPLVPRAIKQRSDQAIVFLFFKILRAACVLRERPVTKDTQMHHRSRVVAQEAERRGLKMNVLTVGKQPTNFFVLRVADRQHIFEGLPGLDPVTTSTNIDDKDAARRIFQKLGAPTPRGKIFTRAKPALEFAHELGWPLVVKPHNGSLGAHTFVNIQNEKDFLQAIRSVKQIRHRFLVEEFINGSLFRAVTVGQKFVACGRRDPPFVTGDGQRAIKELFDSSENQRNAMLKELGYQPEEIPPIPAGHLSQDANTVLKSGEKFVLTWKLNVSYGATVTDVTDDVHPDNKILFEKIAAAANWPCLGIDFIAPSISESWQKQKCALLELNSLPAIDLHYPPIIQGQTRDIAGAILDYILIKK